MKVFGTEDQFRRAVEDLRREGENEDLLWELRLAVDELNGRMDRLKAKVDALEKSLFKARNEVETELPYETR